MENMAFKISPKPTQMVHSATLKSNTGEAELVIEFITPAKYTCQPGFESSIRLNGIHWDGDHTHPFQTAINGLWLMAEDLMALRDYIVNYINQPLDRLNPEDLKGEFELARLPDQSLRFRFEPESGSSSKLNPEVFITMTAGRLRSEFHFVTDQSCLAIFAREMSAPLRGSHENTV
ncbi:hypothetical protein [Pedosphaera parvula]|nr:hypothetical protein [Pedosphaera parvula]